MRISDDQAQEGKIPVDWSEKPLTTDEFSRMAARISGRLSAGSRAKPLTRDDPTLEDGEPEELGRDSAVFVNYATLSRGFARFAVFEGRTIASEGAGPKSSKETKRGSSCELGGSILRQRLRTPVDKDLAFLERLRRARSARVPRRKSIMNEREELDGDEGLGRVSPTRTGKTT